MSDNKLEYEIVAVDSSGPVINKVKANFDSAERMAAKAAQGMSKVFDAQAIEMARSYEKAGASVYRTLQTIEQRAAIAGKSGIERLVAQRDALLSRAGSDYEASNRISESYNRIISAQQRLDRASSARQSALQAERATRESGTQAGKATLSGESEFQDALRRMQSRDKAIGSIEDQARAAGRRVSPLDALREDRQRALAQYGNTEGAVKRINTAFNQMEEAERKALDASRVQRFREGFLNFAVTVAAAGGVVKSFLLDTATYAARTDSLKIANQQLAISNNLSVPAVEKAVTLTKLKGITSQDALNTVNQMIVSGLDVAKAPDLARVAQNQAQIAGSADGHTITSSEALSGIIHGIVERNIRDLRTYAIAVNFQDVFDTWKKNNPGKELSETQKTALALQAVLDFGARSAGVYGATMETVGKQMSSLPRFALEAKNAVGEQLAPALSEGVTMLTRFFMLIERNKETSATLGTGIATAVGALAVFKTGSFLAGLVGLEAAAGPIGMVAAGLTVLGSAYLFTTDKVTAQRDATLLHIEQLNAQRAALKAAGLSQDDYGKELEKINKSSESARLSLINLEVQQKRAGQSVNLSIPGLGNQAASAGIILDLGHRLGILPEPRPFKTMGPEMPKKDNGATVNPELAKADKEAKDAEALADRSRVAQESLTAVKEGRQLKTQLADLDITAKMKEVRARLEKGQLTDPADIEQALILTRAHVDLETKQKIDDGRKRIDPKTGTERDISGTAEFAELRRREEANGNLRLRVETKKILDEFADMDNRHFRARADADFKSWEEAQKRKASAAQSIASEIDRQEAAIRDHAFEYAGSQNDRQRDLALQQIGTVEAQTVKEKIALEDRKLAIEQFYAERSLGIQIAKLESQRNIELSKLQVLADQAGPENRGLYDQAAADVDQSYQQQIDAARQATGDKEVIDAQKVANEKAKIQIESAKSVYQNLKQEAGSLFDQMVYHTKTWGEFFKGVFKTAVMTPIKDIFSSQLSALMTQAITGQKVSFGEVGSGDGIAGKAGGILGRLGLGQPRFGDQQHPLAKLNAPNHLGDVSLVSGAVPVVLMNGGQGASASLSSGGFSLGSLATGLGIGGLLAGGGSIAAALPSAGEAVTSTITYAGGGSETFGGLANLVGGPGGTSGFAGPVAGYGGPSAPSGGLGGFSGILGNLKNLFGLGSSGTDLGNGVGIANTGILGHLAAFGKSGGAAILGGSLAMDGIRRGGALGTLEAAGGGAAVGFKFGGFLGAGIGSAIGGGLALAKTFGLFDGDRKRAKDLVKQVYGMDVNNATADQIVAIARQSYGGQVDVAVRSQQVRDLLRLYSQATGQKSAEAKFAAEAVHSASFVESGGRLQQQAVYDNGNAYAYSSSLGTYGGVQTSPLPTYAPNNGFAGNLQISLNGQAASDALAGQVVRVATPSFVQGQSLSASSSSVGRTSQQNMTLSPSALTR